jgi:hypothetical protein
MSKNDYPSVDSKFIIEKLLKSEKVNPATYLRVGNTHTVNLKGNRPLHKKLIVVREFGGEVNFMQATGLAVVHGFMGELLDWFETKKGWKEGAYINKQK